MMNVLVNATLIKVPLHELRYPKICTFFSILQSGHTLDTITIN